MLTIRKREKTFHADLMKGHVHIVRGSLGTRNREAAHRLIHKMETALSEGPESPLWRELRALLPEETFSRFADYACVKLRQLPTWEDLKAAFNIHREQRIKLGKFAQSSFDRYESTIREFSTFLSVQNVALLQEIDRVLVERFKVWRVERINKRKFSRGATGLVLDAAVLHRVFSFAVENEMIFKNPVRMEGTPGENPTNGAEPFTAAELARMREQAGTDMLAFLLLRWSGLRGSDAVKLTWAEVQFDHQEIQRVTQKRRKRVILPLHTELLFALETEHERLKPQPAERVLTNPVTGEPMTRPRLYQRMVALGKRAGVPNAHPHRFRDTLAVDMLSRGASPYDVAKMLGDTIDTIEKRDRVRHILQNGVGLEEAAKIRLEHPRNEQIKPN
jgi:integrase